MTLEDPLITNHRVGRKGGRLVTALRAEPSTFNPVVALNIPSQTVIRRMTANLIRINRKTQETEAALAKTWDTSSDGRRFTIYLRRGVRFSDGHQFDADDVVFSFELYLNPEVASPIRDLLVIGDKPVRVKKIDRFTIEFELPEPLAAGERLFDGIAMLPKHILKDSYIRGEIGSAWSLDTAEKEIVGLGPFRMKEYLPGSRCVLERNPHYWKYDQEGNRLPYLDELVFVFVPDQSAHVIRFQAGDTDIIDRVSSENFLILKRQSRRSAYRLRDLGPGTIYSFLFFNLNVTSGKDRQSLRDKQSWFRDLSFRKAVSAAIDRQGVVKLAYRGLASPLASHVTPGVARWVNSELSVQPRSIAVARDLLRQAGFRWNRAQKLVDKNGAVVEFSIITSSSNSQRLQMATIIQADLKELGMTVHVVPIEHRALIERITREYDFEASIMAFGGGDTDPNAQQTMLLSSGYLHFWHLGQTQPSTVWEAEIDRLMKEQVRTIDPVRRKQLFDSVQELMAENLPLILLVSPHILVGARGEIDNFNPAVLEHPTLWNVEELFWSQQRSE
ncbi:MAG: ABC transporter substrate-binding protein [bacterium]|nr:ABC transporter substrate-binding protein [bacterium]